MANSATALAAIPALFRGQQPKGLIYPVVVVFDTADSDLTVFTPGVGNFAAVVGMRGSEGSALSLTWKSPAATTLCVEERTTFNPLNERIGRPIIMGQKGEPLILRCTTAGFSSILLYVCELARLELLSL